MTIKYSVKSNPGSPTDMGSVVIEEGQFTGVELRFGDLKFQETSSGPRCSYVYDVLTNPNNVDTNSPEFKEAINGVLDDVLDKSFLRG